MNLEQLCRNIKENYHRLRDEKKALLFLRYQFELLAWKKQKLKLGAIVFEIKETIVAGITLIQEIDIRYIRQDTTRDDELKIENRLKAIGWKWDFKNIAAFIIVFSLALILFYSYLYIWYRENLPTIAFRDERYDKLIYFSLENIFITSNIGIFKSLIFLNFWFINTILNFCINYNMIF